MLPFWTQENVKEVFYSSLDNVPSGIPKEYKIIPLEDGTTEHGAALLGMMVLETSTPLRFSTLWGTQSSYQYHPLQTKKNKFKASWMHPRSKHQHLIDYVIVWARDRCDIHHRQQGQKGVPNKSTYFQLPARHINTHTANKFVVPELASSVIWRLTIRTPGGTPAWTSLYLANAQV